jgi:hypothetical protein
MQVRNQRSRGALPQGALDEGRSTAAALGRPAPRLGRPRSLLRATARQRRDDGVVSERFRSAPLQHCLFTPELQWQSRGKRRISQGGVPTGNAHDRYIVYHSWVAGYVGGGPGRNILLDEVSRRFPSKLPVYP